MDIIGLTGGIGSGKSTVSHFLRERGYMVIDADELSHELTQKGSPTLNEIVREFGKDILLDDGNLNRKKLASMVFLDKEKKSRLERITTDQVIGMMESEIASLRDSGKYDILFIDAPLLFETGADALTDLVWLITADEETRIHRVSARDNTTREDILNRIRNQMDENSKLKRSQEVIDNTKGKEDLYKHIEGLLIKYAETK